MKILEEVIKALDVWMPECDTCPIFCGDSDCVMRDALHYLKLFQADCERVRGQLEDLKQEYRPNDPLTWDELRTMEGKPVWVEVLSDEIDLSSRWMLVARETKAHSLPLAYTDDIGHWIYGHEDKLGKTWQAYRKERK